MTGVPPQGPICLTPSKTMLMEMAGRPTGQYLRTLPSPIPLLTHLPLTPPPPTLTPACIPLGMHTIPSLLPRPPCPLFSQPPSPHTHFPTALPPFFPLPPHLFPGPAANSVGHHMGSAPTRSLLRVLFLTGELDDNLANLLTTQLLFLAAQDQERDILLCINSPGGSASAGLAERSGGLGGAPCAVRVLCGKSAVFHHR